MAATISRHVFSKMKDLSCPNSNSNLWKVAKGESSLNFNFIFSKCNSCTLATKAWA